ncbi:MAG: fibronectin type III domain-containing protein [Bacteroidales bacterium]|nr:fibronectin type III domain-containing protein [Bacteroidales bacterium]
MVLKWITPMPKNVKIYNNIFNDCETEQVNINSAVTATEYILDNNLIFPYKGASGNSRKGTNPIELNPLFADVSAANFYLQPGSPAIDAANPLLVAGFDYINNPRPFGGGYDLGAFEYSGMIEPPAAPTGLTATVVSGSQINLTWTDNASNETGYVIERKAGNDGAFAIVNTVSTNLVGYSDKNLHASTKYTYRVRATNMGGNSDPSNEASDSTFYAGGPGTFAQGGGTNAVVSMEAENFSSNMVGTGTYVGKQWLPYSDIDASQGTYMMVPNAGNANGGTSASSPTLNYSINFTQTAIHYIWARVINPGADDNSITLAYNGTVFNEWHMPETGAWAWFKCAASLSVEAGEQVFSIRMREDGVKIDK